MNFVTLEIIMQTGFQITGDFRKVMWLDHRRRVTSALWIFAGLKFRRVLFLPVQTMRI